MVGVFFLSLSSSVAYAKITLCYISLAPSSLWFEVGVFFCACVCVALPPQPHSLNYPANKTRRMAQRQDRTVERQRQKLSHHHGRITASYRVGGLGWLSSRWVEHYTINGAAFVDRRNDQHQCVCVCALLRCQFNGRK